MIDVGEQTELVEDRSPSRRRVWFFIRVILLLISIAAVKIVVHQQSWEVLAPNPLFPALVASEVFLLGFLLNGVLIDYKEGERLPGELAATLESLATEVRGVREHLPEAELNGVLQRLAEFSSDLLEWMKVARSLTRLLESLDELQLSIERLRHCNPAPLQARLLLEIANIRRVIYRIETIRETTFVPSVYSLAYIGTGLLTGGLVFTDMEPFGESLFFIGVISFVLIKLLLLIADLDNPFATGDVKSVENVSLLPIVLAVQRLKGWASQAGGSLLQDGTSG